MIKKMTFESFLIYGLLGILSLILIDQLTSLISMPDFLIEYSHYLRSFGSIQNEGSILMKILKVVLVFLIPVILFVTLILTLVMVYVNHKKGESEDQNNETADLNHLLPRNGQERFWISILSINAGFSEELFFRLLLPSLIYNITGSALISISFSSLWFGFAHYYQGLNGIISTTIAGFMLFYIYLLTQSLWITILVHIILDINGLVVAPLFKNLLEQKEKDKAERKKGLKEY